MSIDSSVGVGPEGLAGRGSLTAGPTAADVSLPPWECQARRRALGLTPYDLARLAGLEERTVVKLEAALVRPRPVTVVALRNALRRAEAAAASQARGERSERNPQ